MNKAHIHFKRNIIRRSFLNASTHEKNHAYILISKKDGDLLRQ